MINILIAEDHNVVRNGLRVLLEADDNINIIAEAINGQEVLDLLENDERIDMVLSDINMPILDGISLAAELKSRASKAKVVILSMHESENYVFQAFEAGVAGYLLKSASTDELIYAIKHIHAGGHYLCSNLTMLMLKKNMEGYNYPKSVAMLENSFSSRELEVLQLIAEGLTNQQMSDKLFLSKRTIEGHRQSLIDKTAVRNTAGLICFAMRKGLIQ